MAGLTLSFVLLVAALLVEGSFLPDLIENAVERTKLDVSAKMESAALKARTTAENVMSHVQDAVSEYESKIGERVDKEMEFYQSDESCFMDGESVKNASHTSLWKCLELVRVIADATDIATQGFAIATDILGTADNFLQSLTDCLVGPLDSTSDLVSCYLGMLGGVATGIAQNIDQVERYVVVVKRDMLDLHSAIQTCGDQSVEQAAQWVKDQRDVTCSSTASN